jgi:guanine deaminase
VATIIRAKIAHTPGISGSLETFDDGGLGYSDGRILACGEFARVSSALAGAVVVEARDAILLPGFVDCHVHYPQLRVIGTMGLSLLDWLREHVLPEEVRLEDHAYALSVADQFVQALLSHGTTTALVFGSHVPDAQHSLFKMADAHGLRITSGLVVSDRGLLPSLHLSPSDAVEACRWMIDSWHFRGLARYAITPRFAVSCSAEMLEACGDLASSADGLLVTTHLNESHDEISLVGELFPSDADYLGVYERFGLVGARSVFAHDVHVTDSELGRLAGAGAAVAHCASSNAFLGSGLFPFRRHVDAGVRVGLGTDVGAGTSFSMFNEGLAAYQMQRVLPDGVGLGPASLLRLATVAGADALGLADEIGDFTPGKSADYVLVRPLAHSVLASVLERCESVEEMLGALFTLARAESIAEVMVAGRVVWPMPEPAEAILLEAGGPA